VWISGRRKKAADQTWRAKARPLVDEAKLARNMIVDPGTATAPERPTTFESQIQGIVGQLDQAASESPSPVSGQAASSVSSAIQGLSFAVEAARLLRDPAHAVTADELQQADTAVQARAEQLDQAIAELDLRTQPLNAEATPDAGREGA
jgi:hypothetical protein